MITGHLCDTGDTRGTSRSCGLDDGRQSNAGMQFSYINCFRNACFKLLTPINILILPYWYISTRWHHLLSASCDWTLPSDCKRPVHYSIQILYLPHIRNNNYCKEEYYNYWCLLPKGKWMGYDHGDSRSGTQTADEEERRCRAATGDQEIAGAGCQTFYDVMTPNSSSSLVTSLSFDRWRPSYATLGLSCRLSSLSDVRQCQWPRAQYSKAFLANCKVGVNSISILSI